jgi:hypothetical protein
MKYTLMVLLVFLSNTAFAQETNKLSKIEEFHERKWQILITQAQLNPKETEDVKPVFLEHENLMWKLHQENHDFFKSNLKNAKNVKPNYAALNDRYIDNEFKEAQMAKIYHVKLRKILDPETLFRYYKAERDFKRKLLQDLKDRKEHDRH